MYKAIFLLVFASAAYGCSDDGGSGFDLDDYEITGTQCQDGEDNDGDGQVDCEDTECQGFVFCVESSGDTDVDTDGDADTDADTDTAGCLEGNYSIQSSLDVDLLVPYACVNGNLEVVYEDGETSIITLVLPNLVTVGGGLRVSGAGDLKTVSLPNLTTVGGELRIEDNPTLGLVNMNSLASVGATGNVGILIRSNQLLTDLEFAGLTEFNRFIIIEDNGSLSKLTGLNGLTSVNGNLVIENNAVLTDMTGLGNLASVDGLLRVSNNEALPNLDGLTALTSVSGNLEIWGNTALPDCDVCQILSQITSGPDSVDVWLNFDDTCTPVPTNCP